MYYSFIKITFMWRISNCIVVSEFYLKGDLVRGKTKSLNEHCLPNWLNVIEETGECNGRRLDMKSTCMDLGFHLNYKGIYGACIL